jgi:hypothetical protein
MKTIPRSLVLLILGAGIAQVQAVTGKVATPAGRGVAGIAVTLQSTGANTTTDAAGAYSFATTSTEQGAAADRILVRDGAMQVRLAQPTRIRMEVRDAQGSLVVPRLDRELDQGTTTLHPLQGVEGNGIRFIHLRLGDEVQVYRAFRMGSDPTPRYQAVGAARSLAATDTLLFRSGATLLAKVGFASGASTVPDVVLVKRTFKGSITTNGLAVGSVRLDLAPSKGTTTSSSPTYAAGAYDAASDWMLHDPARTWVATVKVLDAAGGQLATTTRSFGDAVESVTFDAMSLVSPTVPAPPADLKASIDWVWENRIKDPTEANALKFYNFLMDQIVAEKGNLYVCVRWESKTKVSAAQRAKFEPMTSRAINNWTKWLKGYDGWPYDSVKVKIVGWAVADASYLDATGLTVPVYVNGGLESEGKAAPICPDACNRDRFHNTGKVVTTYPNCKAPDHRFDITLWGTDGFQGGAGGDWGSRTGASYILSVLDAQEPHIVEHEFGHGFSLPDFYDADQFPPGGLPKAIMQAGASSVITDWDGWMLRRVWTEMKKAEPTRFVF